MVHSNLNNRLASVPELMLQHDFSSVIDAVDELERVTENRLTIDPNWFVYRGVAQYFDGRFDDAKSSYQVALAIAPEHQQANLNLSCILASCPDQTHHNAELAIDHARFICELTNWKEWYALQALAGAFARAGDYSNAKRQATLAYKCVPESQKWRVNRMLELIALRQPHTADLDDDLRKLHSDWQKQIET
ncbi:hypothetical protein [Rubinisphaera sp.]|uniref:hypothetical protein n=1 Tax=Rubinisphaera sp. TaxID=2024857 RepID=UPI000C11BD90|nr:hypothetical protein [Rubinisphaera sp.]MBV11911.1 hypothetical protein [Rubinisphaera sp.]HCS51534.1 hypothetical protein [Planctomycetaceae bacterium]|tara:strand:- start:177 stop:749 length:573 start_codon:yes stop_codon:yes gene_type:complete